MSQEQCATCQTTEKTLHLYWHNQAEASLCGDCATATKAPRLFKVPSFNLDTLKARLEKLGRRAKRLNLPPPTFVELGTERKVKVRTNEITGEKQEKVYLLHTLIIDPSVSEVKVNGFEFVATISHSDEGNILRKVSEREVPKEFRTADAWCVHCQTNRYRKETFVLFSETQGYRQVGRNCLAEYLGFDAMRYAEMAEYLRDVMAMGEANEDGEGLGGGSGPSYEMLEVYLGHVAQLCRTEGFMSRSRARMLDGVVSTADLAMMHLHPSPLFKPHYSVIEPESHQLAEQAIEWSENIPEEPEPSDYLWNLKVIAKRGVVGYKDMGLAASIVSSFQRHLNQLRLQEIRARQAELASYIGEVGQRLVLKGLYLEKVMQFDGQFGLSFLHIFGDTSGNRYTWWGHNVPLEAGKDYNVKATIKKHEDYKGVKQNTLSRLETVELKKFAAVIDFVLHQVEAESEDAAKKLLKAQLHLSRWPRNAPLVEIKETEGEV
jgi:hypothetical protein